MMTGEMVGNYREIVKARVVPETGLEPADPV